MPRINTHCLAGLLATIAIAAPISTTSAALELDWFDTYGFEAPRPDGGRAVVTDAQGNIYVTGESAVATQVHDFVTVKWNAAGERQWLRHYDGDGQGNDRAFEIGVDAAGSVYVGGYSWGGGNFGTGPKYDIVVLKYDPDGNLAWTHRFNSVNDNDDFIADMQVMPDGSVYVTGWSYSPVGERADADYVTYRIAPDGQLSWWHFYDGPEGMIDWLSATLAADASGVCIGASVEVVTGNGDQSIYGAAKYAPDGSVLWQSHWSTPMVPFGFPDFNIVFDSTLDPFGNFILVGRADDGTTSDSPSDAYIVKFDQDGDVAWSVANSTERTDEFERVTTDAQGNVFAVGSFNVEEDFLLHANHVTAAYDANGSFLWEHRFAGDGPWFDGEGFAQMNGAGALVVATRNIMDATGEDMKIFVYDRMTGAIAESFSFDSSCCDWVQDLTLDAEDNIILTGHTRPDGTNRELVVVRITTGGDAATPGDATGDGVVDVNDVIEVITGWGPCAEPPAACPGDVDDSTIVDVNDLVMVVTNWS